MTVLMERLKGRETIITVKIAKKVNNIIDRLENLMMELAAIEVITKEAKEYLVKERQKVKNWKQN